MTIEDDLADAMKAHVAGVQAAPDLGRAVRRRHRAHVLRFRTGGAALLTAAVAVAVPVAWNSSDPTRPPAATGVVMRDEVIVPDVTAKRATDAVRILSEAGLVTEVASDAQDQVVQAQRPAAGERVAAGGPVELDLFPVSPKPQDLGDLGDGREFGGIRLGYVPEGLVWGKWSSKDKFGKNSYSTTFDKPGSEFGPYGIQVFVIHGKNPESTLGVPEQGSEAVDVGGRQARLATVTDGGEIVPDGTEGGTLTISWQLRDDLFVEVCLSPDLADEVDGKAELKRIAEGVSATE
ncbi:PASTA domain-containing protein [Nonomuraea solani]|uniref:PASTA domain-containing protein n=1 Tax=Nonomuraea solani TaxID=1144553 RepID=A0A1H6ETE4_9ACTN|nr:PASTA domain-containing protein [Nonomuraea solani]SEH00286.1 PASTA domain-containing protein [Nonomuraea solani]